jgi:hypothetical protein
MRDTLKAISENTPISMGLIMACFGILMTLGGTVLVGYNMVLEVKYNSQLNSVSIAKLDDRVSSLERGQSAQQSMATDIAVIKAKVEDIQKNLPGRK